MGVMESVRARFGMEGVIRFVSLGVGAALFGVVLGHSLTTSADTMRAVSLTDMSGIMALGTLCFGIPFVVWLLVTDKSGTVADQAALNGRFFDGKNTAFSQIRDAAALHGIVVSPSQDGSYDVKPKP